MRRLALVLLVLTAGCDLSSSDSTATDLLGRLSDRTAFEPLVEAAEDVGLDDALASGGPYTLFAPTATALDYIGSDLRPVLEDPAQREVFGRLLRHHVVRGRLSADDFVDGATLTTLDGRTLAVRRVGPVVEVGGVRIRLTDAVEGDNGIAYEAADVMFGAITTLERVRLSPSLATFERLADRAGALATASAGGVTMLGVFEPGFVALGPLQLGLLQANANTDVLRHTMRSHVVPGVPDLTPGTSLTALDGDQVSVRLDGEQLTVGGRAVLRVEETADGRIVLIGEAVFETLTLGERLRIEPVMQLYMQLVRDVDPALWARLNAPDENLTLFTPFDTALRRMGTNVLDVLRQPENRTLAQRFVRVHVAVGRYPEEALGAPIDVTTADGDVRQAGVDAGFLRFDGRTVRTLDAPGSRNGWLYELSSIAIPLVDGFDSSILGGLTLHARAVRRAGLEALFRSPGLTAFGARDSAYIRMPEVLDRPDLADILRYTATFTDLPIPGPSQFVVLRGDSAEVLFTPCTLPRCASYRYLTLPDSTLTPLDIGGRSGDRQSSYHSLREFVFPPSP